MHNIKAKMR